MSVWAEGVWGVGVWADGVWEDAGVAVAESLGHAGKNLNLRSRPPPAVRALRLIDRHAILLSLVAASTIHRPAR
jgi:hypothetical protein